MSVELLAPAGNMEMLSAAINAGADAVYFGVKGLNMRAASANFSITDISKIVDKCHKNNIKCYLALNTIVYQDELKKVEEILNEAKNCDVDAIICWDNSVILLAKKLNLEIHISTQASISNSISADFYYNLGASRCVLARETTLDDIKRIKTQSKMEIEVFAHGAMCLSESGRCFISENLYGLSANRGQCIQPCRRSYNLIDPETKKELKIEDNYVLSPKDLCILPFLEKLVPYVDALKIEGRGRSPEYVKYVVEAYREALSLIESNSYTQSDKKRLIEKVDQVYNRGFSEGFYMGRPVEEFTDSYGSKSTKVKKYVGYVKNYYKKPMVAEIYLEASNLRSGDRILIVGPTTGVFEQNIESLMVNDKLEKLALKKSIITIKIDHIVRKNDKVYIWETRNKI